MKSILIRFHFDMKFELRSSRLMSLKQSNLMLMLLKSLRLMLRSSKLIKQQREQQKQRKQGKQRKQRTHQKHEMFQTQFHESICRKLFLIRFSFHVKFDLIRLIDL